MNPDIDKLLLKSLKRKDNFAELSNFIQVNKLNAAIVQGLVQQKLKANEQAYRCPAKVSDAQVHRNACSFGYKQESMEEDGRVCACCAQRINKLPLGLCQNTTSFNTVQALQGEHIKLPSGIINYFFFIKMLIVYFFINFIISAGFNLITNLTVGRYCDGQPNSQCWHIFANYASMENKVDLQDYATIQSWLYFANILVSIGYFILFRKKQYELSRLLDLKNQTQNDYTILVSNIPIIDFPQESDNDPKTDHFFYRRHIKQYFQSKVKEWIENREEWDIKQGTNQYDYEKLIQENGGQAKSDQIVTSISLCYNLQRLNILKESRDKLIKQYNKQKANNDQDTSLLDDQNYNNSSTKRFKTIPGQVGLINDCQIVLNKQYASDSSFLFNLTHFVGKAFISFQYQHYKEYILQEAKKDKSFLTYHKQKLKVEGATHPHDVYWENLVYTDSDRKKRIAASYFILFLILSLTFLILYLLEKTNESVKKEQAIQAQNQNREIWQDIKAYGITSVITCVVLFINYVLQIVAEFLTVQEKHQTKSDEKSSLILKLVITQFLNNAIIYFIVSLLNNKPYTAPAGLIYQINSIILLSGVIQIWINLVYPMALWKQFYKWWKYRDMDTYDTFQKTLNQDFEKVQFKGAERYSYYIVQTFTVCFYSFLIPIGVPALVVIFFIQYWIDKLNLFRRSSLFYIFSFELTRVILKIFEFSILLLALGMFLFSKDIKQSVHLQVVEILALIISLLYVIFRIFAPKQVQRVLVGKYQSSQKQIYNHCVGSGKFHETYWTSNPATSLVDEEDVTGDKKIANPSMRKIFFQGDRNSRF